jgi:hypothetical protein
MSEAMLTSIVESKLDGRPLDMDDAIAPAATDGALNGTPTKKWRRQARLPDWRLAELSAQAELHNQRIEGGEVEAAVDYWLLGRVLDQVRGSFRRGTWQPWLARRNIDLTRAKRARQLAQAFDSADELQGLPLHAVLREAKRRKQGGEDKPTSNLGKKLKSAAKKLAALAAQLEAAESRASYSSLAQNVALAAARVVRACDSPTAAEPDTN